MSVTTNDGKRHPIAIPSGLAMEPIAVARSRCPGANQRAANRAAALKNMGVAAPGGGVFDPV